MISLMLPDDVEGCKDRLTDPLNPFGKLKTE